MKRLDRWIRPGEPNRRFAVEHDTETDMFLVAEETMGIPGIGTYRRDKLILSREEVEWLTWAFEELRKA
jgi:hypothetical protein